MNIKIICFSLLIGLYFSLPSVDQLTLASSLIVGRNTSEQLAAWTCKVCNDENKPLHAHQIQENEKDVKCIVTVYPTFIILAFRYTNSALNVWQDILYPLQIAQDGTCSKCKVQKAYYNMWNAIKAEVISDLRQMSKQVKLSTLHITGISLGGGLSVISYIDIVAAKIFSKVDVTTYGAPRVGNNEWALHYDNLTSKTTRRFVVSGDSIPGMPTCLTLLCSYKQVGIKYTCYEDKQTCNREAEVQNIFQDSKNLISTGKRIFQTRSISSIVDHTEGYPKIYNFTLIN